MIRRRGVVWEAQEGHMSQPRDQVTGGARSQRRRGGRFTDPRPPVTSAVTARDSPKYRFTLPQQECIRKSPRTLCSCPGPRARHTLVVRRPHPRHGLEPENMCPRPLILPRAHRPGGKSRGHILKSSCHLSHSHAP